MPGLPSIRIHINVRRFRPVDNVELRLSNPPIVPCNSRPLMTIPAIQSLEALVFTLPRDIPYLGPLAASESVNNHGYVVRSGNRTLYPTVDRSVLVKVTARRRDGRLG